MNSQETARREANRASIRYETPDPDISSEPMPRMRPIWVPEGHAVAAWPPLDSALAAALLALVGLIIWIIIALPITAMLP